MTGVNVPDPAATRGVKSPHGEQVTTQQAVNSVVAPAGRALVVLSRGEDAGEDAVPTRTRKAMDAAASGVMYGRDMWQGDHDASLRSVAQLQDILSRYPCAAGESP
jgi:class I fructose-bisphosphate aldolase